MPKPASAQRHRPLLIDLKGRVFGRLKVDAFAGHGKWGERLWRCSCECGGSNVVSYSNLVGGNTRSCGCIRKDRVRLQPTARAVAVRVEKLEAEVARLAALIEAGAGEP